MMAHRSISKKISYWLSKILHVGLMAIVCLFLVVPDVRAEASDKITEAALAQAEAFCLRTASPSPPTNCIPEAAKKYQAIMSDMKSNILKFVAIKSLYDISTFVANRLAYEAAVFVANGGPGEGSMFYKKTPSEAWATLGKEVGGQAFADLSDITKEWIGLDICTPPNPIVRLNLQLSIKGRYSPQQPRCNFDTVIKNWQQVATDAQALFKDPLDKDQFLYKSLAQGLRPGSNELGASIQFLSLVNERTTTEQTNKFLEQVTSLNSGQLKAVKNFITGDVTTPASMINERINKQLSDAQNNPDSKITPGDILSCGDCWAQVGVFAASTFTNTLLSQVTNRLYKGLFESKPDYSDPFNREIAIGSSGDLNNTKADFAGVFTAPSINISDYSAVANFSVCPDEATGNRTIDNCVFDAGFMSALSQGNGRFLTLKDAIDQKMINGDWPLIPSSNMAANQDRLCYTYGFCYGNLVKLRKARIVPIGWEMAADKQNISKPLSLSQVMNAFDDCNDQGQMDAAHPWCHLIDPNWVLRAPEIQCRATVNGEIRISSALAMRQSVCADAPSCIGEDNSGKCTQGYGYCVSEKNVWRMRGDECPAQYATCLTFKSTTTGSEASYLLNSTDSADCSKQNAGCAWYKTQKTVDANGVYQWYVPQKLNGKDVLYSVADHDAPMRYAGSTGNISGAVNNQTMASAYAYQDRLYFTKNAKSCDATNTGCTELNVKTPGLNLNLIQNGSFEKDEDENGVPDGWTISALDDVSTSNAYEGNVFVRPYKNANDKVVQSVSVTGGQFYTFSVQHSAQTQQGSYLDVTLVPKDQSGQIISLVGGSLSQETCKFVPNVGIRFEDGANNKSFSTESADGWVRYTCIFTLPPSATELDVRLGGNSIFAGNYDAVQLESGENATSFHDGYTNESPTKAYVKLPPAYLGCKGLESDPKECAQYVRMCAAQDAGCNSYTPKDSTAPAVPAIASAVDACPTECVGYESYRQEATRYEPAKFPQYFIADKAQSCPASAVGCDGFTNLGPAAGENKEYYTYLRACVTPDMVKDVNVAKTATYFTWEGSDVAGYQLQTWQLLESNVNKNGVTVDQVKINPPCITPNTKTENSVVCADDETKIEVVGTTKNTRVVGDAKCATHSDIFTNPDCREFFDSAGNIHYRLYSQTVSVDAACTAYRKDVSTESDCKASGGYWTNQGFCRYFVLPKESNACTAAQNGCRMYTGGAGRNATTILNETFENGTSGVFEAVGGASIKPSNDSVSAGGRSLLVSGTTKGITTNATVLQSSLVQGKVYQLRFWAKGTGATAGTLTAKFADAQNGHVFVENLPLSNTWNSYSAGPIDTTKDGWLKGTTRLQFIGTADFNIDNIQLVQTEENITRIKDSWVTPATCDQAPNGVSSPQYYLGCKAYTDRKGVDGSYYQFTHICSEKAVGCTAYYNTQNSASPYGQVTNARCVNLVGGGTKPNGKVVDNPTQCKINNTVYCTIASGRSYCTFTTKQVFADPLLSNTDFAVVYGPETVVTIPDQSVYAIDDGTNTCAKEFKGCREVGAPTYAQDQKTVVSFESKYFIDNPDDYSNSLCEHQSLFCDEYSTSKDGNFYFKNPLSKTCEYKASQQIGGKTYSGWFRTGKAEPCYYTDSNNNGVYDAGDVATLIAGDVAHMWKNGDGKYDGWVGSCPSEANRCTEFVDTTDAGAENLGRGKSYTVLNNNKFTEDSLSASEKCEGQVSQKAGCALFNNTTNSQLKYSSSASYVLSMHADVLLNKKPNDKVDPISCLQDGGKFQISSDLAKKIGTPNAKEVNLCARRCQYAVDPNDKLLSPVAYDTGDTVYNSGGKKMWHERSCLYQSDCPTLTTLQGKAIKAISCKDAEESYVSIDGQQKPDFTKDRLSDDANSIIKVQRDRTCSQWLACDSSHSAWDSSKNKFVQVCDSVNLCNQVGAYGEQAQCQSWVSRSPQIMTDKLYASRDTSWAGLDYSGYEIPRALPVEKLSQFNINPNKWCVDSNKTETHGPSCENDADCNKWSVTAKCQTAPTDYRLVYNAGSCVSPEPGVEIKAEDRKCEIGHCAISQTGCSASIDCHGGAGDFCVKGYCEITDNSNAPNCTTDDDCSEFTLPNGIKTRSCLQVSASSKRCVTSATNSGGTCTNTNAIFVSAGMTITGACYQNRCLTDIRDATGDGTPDQLDTLESDNSWSCRGYPESDSPFPQKVVKQWKTVIDAVGAVLNGGPSYETASVNEASKPFSYLAGYDGSKVCSPYISKDGQLVKNNDNCICSYAKADFGKGIENRYYPLDEINSIPSSVCIGGSKDGLVGCENDDGCKEGGMCKTLSAIYSMYGWHGYCLEKDSSTQINASLEKKDHACLTWLPVDQLSGVTDLYGKEVTAGYQVASNTHYCAEPGVVWDLPMTDVACAAYEGVGCTDSWDAKEDSVFIEDAKNDKPQNSVYCPNNYYVIMAPCGTNFQGEENQKKYTCTDNDTKWTDSSYPYFCVPKNSFHTEGDLKGKICVKPDSAKSDSFFSSFTSLTAANSSKERVYYVHAGTFFELRDYYKDCLEKGVTGKTLENYFGVYKRPDVLPSSATYDFGIFYNGNGYANFNAKAVYYPACLSVVQTGVSGTVGDVNKAWTDRVWQSKQNTYKIKEKDGTIDPYFGYQVTTENAVFGRALDPKDKNNAKPDPDPLHILACSVVQNAFTLPNVSDGKCAAKQDLNYSINEARVYGKFTYGEPVYTVTGQTSFCKNADCSCPNGDNANECNVQNGIVAKCEGVNVTCVGGTKNGASCLGSKLSDECIKNNGTCTFIAKGKCTSGNMTQECTSDDQCQYNVCQEGLFVGADGKNVTTKKCVNKPAIPYTVASTFDLASAIDRIKQIFAKAYSLKTFADNEPNHPYGWYDASESDAVSLKSWNWDISGTANGANPPIVASVGDCYGTACIEKTENSFSVNNQDMGDITGTKIKKANVSFYVHANENQMPLRNMLVDWGDDFDNVTGVTSAAWPHGSTNGSNDISNFYKNHRGLEKEGAHKAICSESDETAKNFGVSPQACSNSYVLFNHDYVCSPADLKKLTDLGDSRKCKTPDGKTRSIGVSPCWDVDENNVAYCQFQPRVYAKDNWGWCTGSCANGPSGKCFGDTACNPEACPGTACGATGADPWVYYNGVIKITPTQQ